MWFKALVGAAAVAIIAGVGVYLWDRQAAQAAAEAATRTAQCREWLSRWSAVRSGTAGPEAGAADVALNLAEICGYEPTADDRAFVEAN